MRLKDFLTLQKLQQADGDLDQEVAGLVYDSRRVAKGDVFFAVPGAQADGHQFVNQAIERGAIAVVVADKTKVPRGVTFVCVHDVRATMGLWAAQFYSQPGHRLKIIGVTGTNGKTTTTYLIESILASASHDTRVSRYSCSAGRDVAARCTVRGHGSFVSRVGSGASSGCRLRCRCLHQSFTRSSGLS